MSHVYDEYFSTIFKSHIRCMIMMIRAMNKLYHVFVCKNKVSAFYGEHFCVEGRKTFRKSRKVFGKWHFVGDFQLDVVDARVRRINVFLAKNEFGFERQHLKTDLMSVNQTGSKLNVIAWAKFPLNSLACAYTEKIRRRNSSDKLTYLIPFYWSRRMRKSTRKVFPVLIIHPLLCYTNGIIHGKHGISANTLCAANCQFARLQV